MPNFPVLTAAKTLQCSRGKLEHSNIKWLIQFILLKMLLFSLQFTDYHIVADGYGGKGLLLSDPSTAEIDATLTKAQDIARDGTAVLINALIGKTDFRQGSISV